MAESFGLDPARYDRARPRYPDALVAAVLDASPGPAVLDVGTGTGIVARQFRAAGARVLGVDVDARMAEFARRRGVAVEVAPFEAWDPAGRTFDAVAAGQTWHWIDPVAGAAKAADVLRPGGRMAAFWNADRPPTELAAAFGAAYRRIMPDALAARKWEADPTDPYGALRARAAEGFAATGSFGDPEEWRFDWERSYTRDEWLDQVPTQGGHSRIPPEVLDVLLAELGAAIDAQGGRFVVAYATTAVTAARLDRR